LIITQDSFFHNQKFRLATRAMVAWVSAWTQTSKYSAVSAQHTSGFVREFGCSSLKMCFFPPSLAEKMR